MSLLVNESYANPSKPLWLAAEGGSTSRLTVDNLTIDSDITFNGDTGAEVGRITAGQTINNTLYIQSDGKVAFPQIGTGNANTYIQISPFGSGGDLLMVGGTIRADALGPPTQIIETPQTTNVLPAITFFAADNVIPAQVNQEFDLNVKLEFGLTAGAYTAGDTVTVYITVDGVPTYQDKGSWEYEYLAGGATGAAANFKVQIRDRMICTNVGAEIKCGVKGTFANPATAVDVTCEQFDCVRTT